MSTELITSIDQVTPAWLTRVLSNSNALTQGSVATFAVDTGRGNWSTNAVLNLQYTDGAQGELPQRLFLKLVNTDLEDEFFGDSEVTYYTCDYIDVDDAPLVRCYDAVYSAEKRRYHLLLDDVSQSHFEAYEKPPTLAYGLALAEGFAAMHARWWGAERLAEARQPIHNPERIRRFVSIAEPGLAHILAHFTPEFEPHWPDLMHSLFANHPQAMIARGWEANGFTLIHGDAGHYNIMVPRHDDRPIYIIDRQPFDWSLTTWLGVYDLSFAMLSWEIETRRQLEMPVLEHYHAQLIERGVRDYTWERLFDDYRLCTAMGVYIAVEYCRGGINETAQFHWLPMLKRALTACDDLNCSQLW
ncbi:MAG: hypothetical protein JXB38_02830 [Anaerolineales bacterium]|nr:hypothetical protein [Anaerolineales bacterium]